MPPLDFYPLDSLRPKDIRVEIRSDLKRSGCKLFYDLLKFDADVEVAVRYAIGNAICASSLATARRLAYEERIGEKIVTMDGEEISKNGAMTGGWSASKKGDRFSEKEFAAKTERLSALEKECAALERRVQQVAATSDAVRQVEIERDRYASKQRWIREGGLIGSVFASEIEAVRSKLQGYAARIATLETDLAQAQQDLQTLQRDEDRLVDALSALLQKLTVAEKRVYGSLMDELGVESLEQLETEMVGKLRENEAMQAECRTHIALLQTKRKFGRERLQSAQRELQEQTAAQSKASKRLGELRARAESEDAGLRALDEELEAVQVAIVKIQRRIREEEGRIGVVDTRIREVGGVSQPRSS